MTLDWIDGIKISHRDALVAAGELRKDGEQRAAAARLAALEAALEAPAPGILSRLIGKRASHPRGLYLWGGVGRGKTMLMDLFHDNIAIKEKRRAHFHAFMADVHARLRVARAPVLVIDRDAVGRGDKAHGINPLEWGWPLKWGWRSR